MKKTILLLILVLSLALGGCAWQTTEEPVLPAPVEKEQVSKTPTTAPPANTNVATTISKNTNVIATFYSI